MNAVSQLLTPAFPELLLPHGDVQLHAGVEQVAYFHHKTFCQLDNRRLPRYAYPKLIEVWPVENEIPCNASLLVVGKNLSLGGLDFFHREPLAHRDVVIALEQGPQDWLYILMEINWCRFLQEDWYDSGGKFIREVDKPESW